MSLPCVLHPVEKNVEPVNIMHQPTKPKTYFNIIFPSNKDVYKRLIVVRVQYAAPLIVLDLINLIVFN